jgi:hypothetical protein
MPWWSTIRSIGDALGVRERRFVPLGCELGTATYREARRAARLVNLGRRPARLRPETIRRLQRLFPELDLAHVQVRTRCRLPANRFAERGSTYAMTFGNCIFWRDRLDEHDPRDLVKLVHELVHVDQVRRLGGEDAFACAYGMGYLEGGGVLPAYIDDPDAYHRNPLEAEAYTFEARFRDRDGRVVSGSLPEPAGPP